jgi:hypothetical protein
LNQQGVSLFFSDKTFLHFFLPVLFVHFNAHSEDRESKVPRNVGTLPYHYKAPQLKRTMSCTMIISLLNDSLSDKQFIGLFP